MLKKFWSFWSYYLFKEFGTYFGILRHIYTTVSLNWELSYNLNTKFHIQMTPYCDSMLNMLLGVELHKYILTDECKSMKGQTIFDAIHLYVWMEHIWGAIYRYILSIWNNKCLSRFYSFMIIYNVEDMQERVKIGLPLALPSKVSTEKKYSMGHPVKTPLYVCQLCIWLCACKLCRLFDLAHWAGYINILG